jgi:biotin carboxyl carrier protein
MAEQVTTMVPGNVWKVLVEPGDTVSAGDTLFILEVMKTEVAHTAATNGKIKAVNIKEGQEGVDVGLVAVEIE